MDRWARKIEEEKVIMHGVNLLGQAMNEKWPDMSVADQCLQLASIADVFNEHLIRNFLRGTAKPTLSSLSHLLYCCGYRLELAIAKLD